MNVTVDATLKHSNNNLIENVLASLFSMYDTERTKPNFSYKDSENAVSGGRLLLQKFNLVYSDIRQILQQHESDDELHINNIEMLSSLSQAVKLRDHLIELKEILEKEFGDIHLDIKKFDPLLDNNLKYLNKYIVDVFNHTLHNII